MFQSNKKFSNIKNISHEKSNKFSAFRSNNQQDDPENQYISGKPYEPYQQCDFDKRGDNIKLNCPFGVSFQHAFPFHYDPKPQFETQLKWEDNNNQKQLFLNLPDAFQEGRNTYNHEEQQNYTIDLENIQFEDYDQNRKAQNESRHF